MPKTNDQRIEALEKAIFRGEGARKGLVSRVNILETHWKIVGGILTLALAALAFVPELLKRLT